MPSYHLAQVNIARMLAPIDSPVMADFVARLAEINALGDAAPGFVWRLQTAQGDATSLRVFDDEFMIVNLTVWESADALYAFTYQSEHVEVFRRRREWFHKLDTPYLALWWIPAGTLPTTDEAKSKLEYLRRHGATPLAFTFKQRYTADEMLQTLAARSV